MQRLGARDDGGRRVGRVGVGGVAEAVPVGIGKAGMRVGGLFGEVRQPVRVRVLGAISDAVAIGVTDPRVGQRQGLLEGVGKPVTVHVDRPGRRGRCGERERRDQGECRERRPRTSHPARSPRRTHRRLSLVVDGRGRSATERGARWANDRAPACILGGRSVDDP